MIVRCRAYPRVGLIGNPSDGFFGKTVSFAFTEFSACVTLYETPELEILPSVRDHSVFRSLDHLVEDVRLFGYYGGIRLLKAAVKRFHAHCESRGLSLDQRNFTIRYESDIPHLVGLAGSSAIVTACMRALMEFFGVSIPRATLANLILAVEREELGIAAGLQDRVAQAYQGLVYMDFDRAHLERQGVGRYEELDPKRLPPLYVGYRTNLAECSDVVHSDLRDRYSRGDTKVLAAIRYWADLADQVRAKLDAGRGSEIGPLLNANFDKRREVCAISDGNLKMVEAARSVGASAKFTGSGGAIVGTYEDERMFGSLTRVLGDLGVAVFKPTVAPPIGRD